jgi:transcription antitermination factor NusG
MSSSSAILGQFAAKPPAGMAALEWYAIQTRSRHEKMVARQLELQGITAFLPVVTKTHKWSDRSKTVELPLFPGYAFVRVAPFPEDRIAVLKVLGVVNFIGSHGRAIPIPEWQIEAVKAVVSCNIPFKDHPHLRVGQRVRVCGGSLDGVEGILVAQNGTRNLVISVEPIQRSLSVQIEGYDVVPIEQQPD